MTIESGAGSQSKLPWTGLLSRAQVSGGDFPFCRRDTPGLTEPTSLHRLLQLVQLKDAIPNFIICPGYTSRFGTVPDETGKVYVAGATSSYSHAKSTFLRWAAKDTESVRWWMAFVKEKVIEPITVSQERHTLPSGTPTILIPTISLRSPRLTTSSMGWTLLGGPRTRRPTSGGLRL